MSRSNNNEDATDAAATATDASANADSNFEVDVKSAPLAKESTDQDTALLDPATNDGTLVADDKQELTKIHKDANLMEQATKEKVNTTYVEGATGNGAEDVLREHNANAPMSPTQKPEAVPLDCSDASPTKVSVSQTNLHADILTSMTPEEREAELRGQVTSLNTKLVAAINRMSDLEDELTVAQNSLRHSAKRLDELSKERDQYINALSTGLLVEKSHVASEMQRMMERVVDATAQRGKAESDKTRIEAELEELSASLFNEANKMVAVERLNRALSESRSKELEATLIDTEKIMADQQEMLKSLQSELEALQDQSVGQGQVAEPVAPMRQSRLFTNIPPYQEFLSFLAHLRGLRQQLEPYFAMAQRGEDWMAAPPAVQTGAFSGVMTPANSGSQTRHRDYPYLPMAADQLVHISGQLSLPFIRRIMEEDTDPCLRLSQAPGLHWLARRQASAAVLDGEVVIEPLFPGGIVHDEKALRTDYGSLPAAPCSLCSAPLLNLTSVMDGTANPAAVDSTPNRSSTSNWSHGGSRRSLPSLFQTLRRSNTDRSRTPPMPDESKEKENGAIAPRLPGPNESLPIPTHFFRLSEQATSRYLLCSQHCLYRLRAICAMWAFVRTIERSIVLEGKNDSESNGPPRPLPPEVARTLSSQPARPQPRRLSKTSDGKVKTETIEDTQREASNEDDKADKADYTEGQNVFEASESQQEISDVKENFEKLVMDPADDKEPLEKSFDAGGADMSAAAENTASAEDTMQQNETDAGQKRISVSPSPLLPTVDSNSMANVRASPAPLEEPKSSSFVSTSNRQDLTWEENLWMDVLRHKELVWKVRVGMDLDSLNIV